METCLIGKTLEEQYVNTLNNICLNPDNYSYFEIFSMMYSQNSSYYNGMFSASLIILIGFLFVFWSNISHESKLSSSSKIRLLREKSLYYPMVLKKFLCFSWWSHFRKPDNRSCVVKFGTQEEAISWSKKRLDEIDKEKITEIIPIT